jgi:hypothetical protein
MQRRFKRNRTSLARHRRAIDAARNTSIEQTRSGSSGGLAMNATHTTLQSGFAQPGFELRFQSLFDEGRALAFPCDAVGRVDLDALSERARCNYFYARSFIGRDFAMPAVQRCFATLH